MQRNNILWNTDYEKILKEWKAKSFVNMWLNMKSSYYYNSLNDWLTYPVIILSSISATILFSTDISIARLIIAIFYICTVIIAGLLIELSPGQKSEQYMVSARRYTILIRNIDYCLSIPPYMRTDPIKFIEKVNIELDNIADVENIIPKYIIKNFEKQYGSIEKLLYGEEIIDLITEDIKTMKIASKLLSRTSLNRNSDRTSEINSDRNSEINSDRNT